MKNRVIGAGILSLVVAGCAANTSTRNQPQAAPVRMVNSEGQPVGSAVLSQTKDGVRVNLNVQGLPPGTHGVHIHENGMCDPPGFTSAGGHFNPTTKQHGSQNPQGPHVGDLPNLTVGQNGQGQLEAVAKGATLRGPNNTLLKTGGTALVIHANTDDYRTDPSGNSGGRIACGVIRQDTLP